jgi:hypothetical protein
MGRVANTIDTIERQAEDSRAPFPLGSQWRASAEFWS